MKRLMIATVLAFAFSLMMTAQDEIPFFPMTKGAMLTMSYYDDDGDFEGYYTQEVREVTGNVKNGTVQYVYKFFDDDKEPFFKAPNEMIMDVDKKGGTVVSTLYELKKAMKTQDIFTKGDASHIPSELTVGMQLPDGLLTIIVGNIKSTIKNDGRKVLDKKDITTEAGTFECYLIQEHQVKKTLGTTENMVKTWYAQNIGCVKQEVYDMKGRLVSTQRLTAYKAK